MSEPDWTTAQEVAQWLRVTRVSIYRLIKKGLPFYRIGTQQRFKRAEVEAWRRAQAEATIPTPVEHVRASVLPDPKPVRPRADRQQPAMSIAEARAELTRLMTPAEVATRLKMHPDAVRRLIYEGKLQASYVGGRRIRITERHIESFLRTHARPS